MTNITSKYFVHRNTRIDWCSTDTHELYLENFKNNYDRLKQFGWIDSTVSYSFNSHGFRCQDFTTDPGIMFLGCSLTLGVGVNIEDTWSYIVAKELNLPYINLGHDGSSADTAYRLARYWIPELKPKIVVLLVPNNTRMEVIHNHNAVALTVSMFSKFRDADPKLTYFQKFWSDFYKDWVGNEENCILNNEKNVLAINALCTQKDIKFLSVPVDDFRRYDFGRDLEHHGIYSHKRFSKEILNKV